MHELCKVVATFAHNASLCFKCTVTSAMLLTARVHEEFERLVPIFVGSEGLPPSAWPQLPHKVALVAERNMKRQDKLDKEW